MAVCFPLGQAHSRGGRRAALPCLSRRLQSPPGKRTKGMSMWFYLNGRFVEDAEATVPVTDHSFLYGDGCFEGIGVCNGRVLHLDEHVERLFKSTRMLRIAMPVSPAELH